MVGADLPADFPARVGRGVDITVAEAGAEKAQQPGEGTRRHVLPRHGLYVRGGPKAGDCAAMRRAVVWAGLHRGSAVDGCSRSGAAAEEDHDSTVDAARGEVDVREQRPRGHPGVRQSPVDSRAVGAQRTVERAGAPGQLRRHFAEVGKARAERGQVIVVVGAHDQPDCGQRHDAKGCQYESDSNILHFVLLRNLIWTSQEQPKSSLPIRVRRSAPPSAISFNTSSDTISEQVHPEAGRA